MADIALRWNKDGFGDIDLDAADLSTDEGLESALLISVFTDRVIDPGEALPVGEVSRRGWWGDTFATADDKIGSKLWLLDREKTLQSVVQKANEYLRECVQWLIDDKIAERVETLAEHVSFQQLDLYISVYRPGGDVVKFRYAYEWETQLAK